MTLMSLKQEWGLHESTDRPRAAIFQKRLLLAPMTRTISDHNSARVWRSAMCIDVWHVLAAVDILSPPNTSACCLCQCSHRPELTKTHQDSRHIALKSATGAPTTAQWSAWRHHQYWAECSQRWMGPLYSKIPKTFHALAESNQFSLRNESVGIW